MFVFFIFFVLLTILECPNETYLAYDGRESVCIDVMPAASCADMEEGCHALYGEGSMLLQITSYGIIRDAITALEL